MTADWSERDRLESALTPRAWTTNPGKVTREDLFNAIDLLGKQLAEKDALMDSAIRARLTEIRSLAATLVPKRPALVCGYSVPGCGNVKCQIRCGSESSMAEHRERVHGIVPEFGAAEILQGVAG